MAKKEPRISINKLEGMLNERIVNVPFQGDSDVEVRIKRNLSLNEMLQFVEDVVSSCVNAESGVYSPEVMWFAIYSGVLTMYANFNLPSSIEKQYDLIYNTDAVEFVMSYINRGQYDEIVDAIRYRIDHERKIMESTMAKKMNDIVERMDSYIQQNESLFESVDEKDMAALVKNLASIGKLDEEKLVRALAESQKMEQDEKDKTDRIDERTSESDTSENGGTIVVLPRKK